MNPKSEYLSINAADFICQASYWADLLHNQNKAGLELRFGCPAPQDSDRKAQNQDNTNQINDLQKEVISVFRQAAELKIPIISVNYSLINIYDLICASSEPTTVEQNHKPGDIGYIGNIGDINNLIEFTGQFLQIISSAYQEYRNTLGQPENDLQLFIGSGTSENWPAQKAQAKSSPADASTPGELSYESATNNLFFALENLLKTAEQVGIILAVENPDFGIMLSPLELRDFVDEFNTPWLTLGFNPQHCPVLTRPQDWLNILQSRVTSLRIDHQPQETLETQNSPAYAGPYLAAPISKIIYIQRV